MGFRIQLIALVFLVFLAPTSRALVVSIEPAWNGVFRKGLATELTVRVAADRHGKLRLKLADSGNQYIKESVLRPNTEYLWRPVLVPNNAELTLSVTFNDGNTVERAVKLEYVATHSPIVAIIADSPISLKGISDNVVHITGRSMPFHHSSYATTELVVVDSETLLRVTAEQLSALENFAARCGRVLIFGISSEALSELARHAGCSGNFLAATRTPKELKHLAAQLLQQAIPQPPDARRLRTLLNDNAANRDIHSLAVFFVIYVCGLFVAATRHRPVPYLLCTYAVALIVGFVIWTLNPEQMDRVTWSEMTSGSENARFTALHRVRAGGRHEVLIPSAIAEPLIPLRQTSLTVTSDESSDSTEVRIEAGLYEQVEFSSSGVIRQQQSLSLQLKDGVPHIFNGGTSTSPAAFLAWRDTKYNVPPLAPSTGWIPQIKKPDHWRANRIEQLFRQHVMNETAALLVEISPTIPGLFNASTDLLMIRP